jgi:succinoglycan biosynthesis transport protein ExoP
MFFRRKAKDTAPAVALPPRFAIPAGAPGEPDMSGLGRALWAKKTKIIGFTLLVTALAIVVVNVITPRYRSETRILLEAKENVFLRAEADKVADRTVVDPESVTSQTQVLLSRDLAREVIRKEGLKENPEFNSSGGILKTLLGLVGLGRGPSDMSAEERTLEAFYARLNVFAVDKSRVISVSFSSADPDLASNVANTIAATYLTLQQTAKQQQTRDASQWLAGEIANLRQKVSEAESNVERYRTQSNLYGGANNTSLPTQQLTEINSQIATVRGQKADLETRARQLREMLRSGRSVDASDVANSETIRRLTEQRVTLRAQIAEQSTTLLGQHPRMRELNAQAGELDRQIRTEGERLVRQLENDAKVSGDRLTQLTASLDQVKKLASATNEQDVQLRAIEREAKAQRELLESYLAKYREAIARDNINAAPAEARIISRASPAIAPDYPKKMPIVLIAAFAAFTLSAGFVATGELLSPSGSYAYSVPPAAYVASPPMAPVMPTMPAMPRGPATVAPRPVPMAPAMAGMPVGSVEQVAAALRQAGDAGRRVVVAGSGRNVGTTYAAIALARALAQSGNVILIDLAWNAPNLSVVSTDPQAPGMAELLRGQTSFGEIITRDQFSNVHLIATGNVAGEGASLAASQMLPGAIEALAQSYDHVVLDVGAVTDVAPEYFAALAGRAVLVAPDAAAMAGRSARDRLVSSGFADVSVLLGGAEAAAA